MGDQTNSFIILRDKSLIIEKLEILDEELVSYLAGFPEEARGDVVRRAVKIGLLSLKGSTTIERIDYIEKEFNNLRKKLGDDLADFADRSRKALDEIFKGDGSILKTTLDRYLGEGGRLEDLFDPERKDSAISKMSSIFDEHFKGRDSVLYRLLDHNSPESPIGSLKKELVEEYLKRMLERIIGKEAAQEEREKGTAKGREYQKEVFDKLNELCKPFLDTPEYTAEIIGKLPRNKVGDAVVIVAPSSTCGISLRIVIEAKDSTGYSLQKTLDELDEAKKNRDACVGIAVFKNGTCPVGCEPLQQYGDDKIICIYDPEDSQCLALSVAYRLSRVMALNTVREEVPKIDASQMRSLVTQCDERLKSIYGIKGKITKLANDINNDLDALKTALEEPLRELEKLVTQVETSQQS